MTTDIELVSTDDLIAELERRHRSTLILLVNEPSKTSKDASRLSWAYSGSVYTALGMAQRFVQCGVDASMEPDDDEDDATTI